MGDDELVICDPRVFDTVLRKEGKWPIGAAADVTTFNDYYKETNNTMGLKGISTGPTWKEWRQPLEKDMFVEWAMYLPDIAKTASQISQVAGYEVTEQKNIEFVDFISRSSFDMFTTVMYGKSPQTTNSEVATTKDIEFVISTSQAFDLTGEVLTNPLEKVFDSDLYQKFKVKMDQSFTFGKQKTDEFVKEVEQKNAEAAAAIIVEGGGVEDESSKCPVTAMKEHLPFVERLVKRGKVSREELLDFSGPLLMAGVDTTSYVMSWIFLNLASNPDKQRELADELKSVLKGADLTTVEQMDNLPYLKSCIRESHRLTPSTPISTKKLKDDIDVIVGNEAYRVPAGKRISLNLRGFPMDPKYVDSPHQFMPERFMPDAIESRKGTPSEIIDHPSFADPFGRGKRRCLGANMAIAEIRVLVARLIQDYDISLIDDAKTWKPKQRLMLKADPYPAMKLVPRV